ncbi:hypothetical protein [Streptomyces albus]|uniref:hypothetical protein n=1 Tax=Streptomyces albus TaxID=1888 RepID=UPI001570DFA4|nr:hypothetical protein [Streptomyces albus]
MSYYDWRNLSGKCDWCGEELSGRRERFCGNACRLALRRSEKAQKRQRACGLCGQSFIPQRPRQKFCDYYEDADDICREKQDDRDEDQELAEMDLAERRDACCEQCGKAVKRAATGRVAKYCGNLCRQKAYYERKKGQAL